MATSCSTFSADTEKPRRPLSAYNIFFKEQRQEIKRVQSSSSGVACMVRAVAGKWNALDEQSKQPYKDLARVEKIAYKKALATWKKHQRMRKRQKTGLVSGHSSVETGNESVLVQTDPSARNQVHALEAEQDSILTNDDSNHTPFSTSSGPTIAESSLSTYEEGEEVILTLGNASHANLTRGLDRLAACLEDDCVEWLVQAFLHRDNNGDEQRPAA